MTADSLEYRTYLKFLKDLESDKNLIPYRDARHLIQRYNNKEEIQKILREKYNFE